MEEPLTTRPENKATAARNLAQPGATPCNLAQPRRAL